MVAVTIPLANFSNVVLDYAYGYEGSGMSRHAKQVAWTNSKTKAKNQISMDAFLGMK